MILDYLTRTWRTLAIAAGIVVLVAVLAYLKGRSDQKRMDDSARVEANNAALVKKGTADASAADERLSDQSKLDAQAKERTDAIAQSPDDPYRALACQRLRAAGKNSDADASGCGR